MSTVKPYMEFGDRLKTIRTDQNLSQKEMADKLNLAVSTYQYYERGERETPTSVAIELTLYGVNPCWLLTGKGKIYTIDQEESLKGNDAKYNVRTSEIEQVKEFNHEYNERRVQDQAIDNGLLSSIIAAIEKELDSRGLHLAPEKKAEAISLLYDMYFGSQKPVDKNTIGRYLRLVA